MRKIEEKMISSVGELMRGEREFIKLNSNLNLERIEVEESIVCRIYGVRVIEFFETIDQVCIKIHKNDSLTFKRYVNSFLKGLNLNFQFFTKNGKLKIKGYTESDEVEIILIDFDSNEILNLDDYII